MVPGSGLAGVAEGIRGPAKSARSQGGTASIAMQTQDGKLGVAHSGTGKASHKCAHK